jgi:transposase
MITEEIQQAIGSLHQQGIPIRQIGKILKISRNTIKRVIRGRLQAPRRESPLEELMPAIREVFTAVKGNVVRIMEILKDRGHSIPYSTLTRMVREFGLRERKKRSGSYVTAPGEEMQHDTSPHQVVINGKKVKAQCAGLVLAYSRRLFIQYYPSFTRFEARVFLDAAFRFMGGACPVCIIDNTHVVVAHGSGPDADIAPEMERFGQVYGITFVPHAIGDADRKGKIERNFAYAENNFLAGRTFLNWHDVNEQALRWCNDVANQKIKRSLGMSPEAAYLMEKPHLVPLPVHIPPVYQTVYRTVDIAGYVHVDTNRYSVPEKLIGQDVEIHKSWDRIEIFSGNRKVADHPRLLDRREARVTAPGHHLPLKKERAHSGPSEEERALLGHHEWLDRFVLELKRRSKGRGIRHLRRLLVLKRTYPPEAFEKAIREAAHYSLYDLSRIERLILSHVAGDFFSMEDEP